MGIKYSILLPIQLANERLIESNKSRYQLNKTFGYFIGIILAIEIALAGINTKDTKQCFLEQLIKHKTTSLSQHANTDSRYFHFNSMVKNVVILYAAATTPAASNG